MERINKILVIASFLFILLFVSISSVSSAGSFGYDYLEHEEELNYSNIVINETSNQTEYWNTNEGSLDGVNSTQFENQGSFLGIKTSWLTSFLDNTYCKLTGCTMQGDINQTTGDSFINNIYGEMWYYNDTGTELNFASAGTFYNIFMPNATHLNGFTYQGGFLQTSNLTAQYGGMYKASFDAIGDGQNNHIYKTALFVNGVIEPSCRHEHKMAAGGDIVTHGSTCLVELDAGDVVDVRTADIGNTGTGNYYGADLNLVRIGN